VIKLKLGNGPGSHKRLGEGGAKPNNFLEPANRKERGANTSPLRWTSLASSKFGVLRDTMKVWGTEKKTI